MGKNTHSFYLAPQTLEVLDARAREREDGGRSETLATIVGRYAEVCRRDLPDFPLNEWHLVCDALNGIWMHDSFSLAVVWAEVADAISINGLDKKHDVPDGQALVKRIHALTYGQIVALVDLVERWWLQPDGTVLLPGEAPPGVVDQSEK